ncbi:MAG: GTP-binding protein, partial [Clostridia bacterium]|nr:GTP-binding protein [Clostridia bacterium]
GKTTLIKKLIQEAYKDEKLVLIENEFGEIGIDGGFLQDAGVNITEMNSGCICCSLVGDFSKALEQVAKDYSPDRIIIEPSGVGKLSDVIKAVSSANVEGANLNAFCTVVDAGKCKMYIKNFGEFFLDQVEHANTVILSHVDRLSDEKLSACVHALKEINPQATFVTASWNEVNGKNILSAMEKTDTLQAELERLSKETHHHEHHHDHDGECCCHDHHDHHEHHEHHHDHDEECCCHDHHDHHEHHEHHHHHADEVFTSWGVETERKFTKEEIEKILNAFAESEEYGVILRAKGIVRGENAWIHFDYVPGEPDVREGSAGVTGRLCVIGCNLDESAIEKLFQIS